MRFVAGGHWVLSLSCERQSNRQSQRDSLAHELVCYRLMHPCCVQTVGRSVRIHGRGDGDGQWYQGVITSFNGGESGPMHSIVFDGAGPEEFDCDLKTSAWVRSRHRNPVMKRESLKFAFCSCSPLPIRNKSEV
jgi:hypothetical protein